MKLSKFFINLLAAGTVSMLCCAGAAAEPINSLDAAAGEVSGSAVDEKVKEVDGRKYAEKRSKIYFETFKKAYDCLEEEGYTATVHGKGTYVTGTNAEMLAEQRRFEIQNELEKVVKKAEQYGVSHEEIAQLLSLIFEE